MTYAVERLSNVNVVKNSALECVVLNKPPYDDRGDAPDKSYDAKDYMTVGARQYRITVLVTDARNTQTWTQSLVTLN